MLEVEDGDWEDLPAVRYDDHLGVAVWPGLDQLGVVLRPGEGGSAVGEAGEDLSHDQPFLVI